MKTTLKTGDQIIVNLEVELVESVGENRWTARPLNLNNNLIVVSTDSPWGNLDPSKDRELRLKIAQTVKEYTKPVETLKETAVKVEQPRKAGARKEDVKLFPVRDKVGRLKGLQAKEKARKWKH